MLQATTTTLNNITSPSRSIKGKVALIQGATNTDIKYNDDLIELKVDRVGENAKFFGFGVSQKATVKIRDKQRSKSINTDDYINIYFSATDENDFIKVTPNLYIKEISRDENNNDLTIIGYDKLMKANELTVNELSLNGAYSINNLLNGIKTALGVAAITGIDTTKITNIPEVANLGGTETLRAVLDDIAEVAGAIYYIDTNNNLVFKQLSKEAAVLDITKNDYFTMTSKRSYKLKTVTSVTELGDNITANSTITSGVTQYIRENCFLNNNDNASNALANILTTASGLTITELSFSWRGNYLIEIGDRYTIEKKSGGVITTYLLSDSYTYNGGFKSQVDWAYLAQEQVSANPVTIGEVINQTTARVDKINKEITLTVEEFKKDVNNDIEEINTNITLNTEGINIANSKIDANTEALAAININTESITSTVEKIEKNTSNSLESLNDSIVELGSKITQTAKDLQLEFNEKITTEAESVTTSTGFTFNSSGLTIDKSGSEIKTQITENGMTVYRNNKAMLVANNAGVDATNLRATTYLIIGNKSRFETMKNGRTGCFWIG